MMVDSNKTTTGFLGTGTVSSPGVNKVIGIEIFRDLFSSIVVYCYSKYGGSFTVNVKINIVGWLDVL